MIETRGEKTKEKAKNNKKRGAKKEGSDGTLSKENTSIICGLTSPINRPYKGD